MQAQFAQDNNPDAQTLQKLADMTGLSRRVIQVSVGRYPSSPARSLDLARLGDVPGDVSQMVLRIQTL